MRRIEQAQKYVTVENLALSTQCGFASAASGNLITWDDMQRKLELVAEDGAAGVGVNYSRFTNVQRVQARSNRFAGSA